MLPTDSLSIALIDLNTLNLVLSIRITEKHEQIINTNQWLPIIIGNKKVRNPVPTCTSLRVNSTFIFRTWYKNSATPNNPINEAAKMMVFKIFLSNFLVNYKSVVKKSFIYTAELIRKFFLIIRFLG